MDDTRGITVKIDAALHARTKADQEARGITMGQYITLVLEEHFNMKEVEPMNTRTMAFQIDDALFQRIKMHLTRTGMTQRAFVISLIEQALAAAETEVAEPDVTEQAGGGPEAEAEG